MLLLGFCFGGLELLCLERWERWELFSQGLRLDFVRYGRCWARHVDGVVIGLKSLSCGIYEIRVLLESEFLGT